MIEKRIEAEEEMFGAETEGCEGRIELRIKGRENLQKGFPFVDGDERVFDDHLGVIPCEKAVPERAGVHEKHSTYEEEEGNDVMSKCVHSIYASSFLSRFVTCGMLVFFFVHPHPCPLPQGRGKEFHRIRTILLAAPSPFREKVGMSLPAGRQGCPRNE